MTRRFAQVLCLLAATSAGLWAFAEYVCSDESASDRV